VHLMSFPRFPCSSLLLDDSLSAVLTQRQSFEAFALVSPRLETVSVLVGRRQAEFVLGQAFLRASESVREARATLFPQVAPAGSARKGQNQLSGAGQNLRAARERLQAEERTVKEIRAGVEELRRELGGLRQKMEEIRAAFKAKTE